MTDHPTRPDHEPSTGTPRWVWVSAIIAGVVAVLVVILTLLPGHGPLGEHGPFNHG